MIYDTFFFLYLFDIFVCKRTRILPLILKKVILEYNLIMLEIFNLIKTGFKSESIRDKTVVTKEPHPNFSQVTGLEISQLYLICNDNEKITL